ncbi:MAG: DUF4252 domain-containing protein [Bacteroidia bacterium]|nr:DUF4252 domain-containing protein [Bacteroidia bacterium]NND10111.1 DUF4252 domain-containing protein [Flavobacteriaceae bacterium]MBT8308891.1 DUF4252 domain-containing protein [Bacteroidia bacterium]NNK27974.1 DUF4252 domain-containing protein [Flavobacteriaceae bacterium]NNL60374.1 DUF4252 domain-containing protein [Flavobacteriaceae bacterium]
MKKLVIVLAVILAPMLSFGQSMFDKYEDMDEVASIIVNSKMFQMLATIDVDLDDPEAQEYFDMVKKIDNFKVMTTGDEGISANMKADVNKYLKNANLEELMRIKDGDQNVKFYVREGKDANHVKELLMFITGLKEAMKDNDVTINGKKREFETVLLSLTGDIDLRQVSKITQKMDIKGGEHLDKVGDKKN